MIANINHSLSFKDNKLQVTKEKKGTYILIKSFKLKLESVSLNKHLFFLWKSLELRLWVPDPKRKNREHENDILGGVIKRRDLLQMEAIYV